MSDSEPLPKTGKQEVRVNRKADKIKLTSESESALVKVDEALNDQLIRINIAIGWDLIILTTEHTPTGCLWQEGPLEWLHLPVNPRKIVLSYPSLVAQLIIKGRKRSVELFGKEVANIVIPFNKDQLQVFYKIVMIGKLP